MAWKNAFDVWAVNVEYVRNVHQLDLWLADRRRDQVLRDALGDWEESTHIKKRKTSTGAAVEICTDLLNAGDINGAKMEKARLSGVLAAADLQVKKEFKEMLEKLEYEIIRHEIAINTELNTERLRVDEENKLRAQEELESKQAEENRLAEAKLQRLEVVRCEEVKQWGRQERFLKVLARRQMHAGVIAAWGMWAANAKELAREQNIVDRIEYKLSYNPLFNGVSKTFNTWHAHCAEANRLKHAASKVLERWDFCTMGLAWETFSENVKEQVRQKTLMRKVRKVLSRWMNKQVWGVLVSWQEYSARSKLFRFIEFKLEDRRSSHACVAALRQWKNNIHDKQRQRRIVLRMVRRRSNLVVSKCWGVWTQHQASSELARCQRGKLSSFVHKLRGLNVLKAFTRWKDVQRAINAQEARRQVISLRIVRKWMSVSLWRCFRFWFENVRASRIVSRLVKRMRDSQKARVFDGFVKRVEESKTLRRKMAQAVAMWRRPLILVYIQYIYM